MFDLKDTIHTREVETKRPKELVCRISLPKINSAAKVDLDVGNRYLSLEVKDVYSLERRLPYEVIGEKVCKVDKEEESTCRHNSRETTPQKACEEIYRTKSSGCRRFGGSKQLPLVSEVVSSTKSATEAISEEKGPKEERGKKTPSHLKRI